MNGRIEQHPIIDFSTRGKRVFIFVNGQKIAAYEGEPIAAAIIAAGIKVFRHTPKRGMPRSVYCAIGRCSDCVMVVDGTPSVRTCVTPVKDGMIIENQEM
jgi:predicted molibdopterin-dependent oxidoreductase YjgC